MGTTVMEGIVKRVMEGKEKFLSPEIQRMIKESALGKAVENGSSATGNTTSS